MLQFAHSALSDHQLAQVAWLFADEFFGTDAGGYVYFVDAGVVIGRRAENKQPMSKVRTAELVTVKTQEDTAADENTSMPMSTGALAALLAENIINKKFEEVHHE